MIKQQTTEWFAQREGKVTGSKVGAILGLNPWRTPKDVLDQMLGKTKFEGNVATDWGNAMEASAREAFELLTGFDVKDAPFVEKHDWLGASPDGYIGELGLIEIKCPWSRRDSSHFKSIEQMPYYHAQVQVQLYCTGREYCWFFQYSPYGYRLELIRRDDDYLAEVLPKLKKFHEKYLDLLHGRCNNQDIPTNPTGGDTMNVKDYIEIVERCNEISRIQDELKKEYEGLRELLTEELPEGSLDIGDFKVTKSVRKGSIPYGKIVKENLPDLDLEPYRGEPSYTLRITPK